jgi:hypothetical protein
MKVLGHTRRKEPRHAFGDPLLVEEEKHVRLACGHEARGVSVITFPDHRRGYRCPEGCGIKRATRILA